MPTDTRASVNSSQAIAMLQTGTWMLTYLLDERRSNLIEDKVWILSKIIRVRSSESLAIELMSGKKTMRLNFDGKLSFVQRIAHSWNPNTVILEILMPNGLTQGMVDTGHRVTIDYHHSHSDLMMVAALERCEAS